jgi:hypothetical protein
MTCHMKDQRMKTRIEKTRIVRGVQSDLAKAQESLGVPVDKRERVPGTAIREVLKVIEENDEALRFLATC